jgi:hypothetical protein
MDLVDVTTQVPPPFGLDTHWACDVGRAELAVDLATSDIFHRDWTFGRPDVSVTLVAGNCHWSLEWYVLDVADCFGSTADHFVVVW